MNDIGKCFLSSENELKHLCNALDKKKINNKTYLICNEGVGINLSDSLLGRKHKCSKYDISNEIIIDNHTTCILCDHYHSSR